MTQAKNYRQPSCGDRVKLRVRRKRKNTPYSNINHLSTRNQSDQSNQMGTYAGIKIAHVNINSIRNKVDLLYTELHDYDIICVSETKLNPSISTSDLEINGFYPPVRKDRQSNNGGGLIIYIKRNILFKQRLDLENRDIENIWIEITCLNKTFLAGLFYRPPNSLSDYWNSFENNIDNALDTNLDVIILGDLNHDMLKQDRNSKLQRIMSKYNLHNMILEPTRVTPQSQTCIDLILTNHNSLITNTEVLPPFCSDHSTITAEINFKTFKTKAYKTSIWKYEEANKMGLSDKLNTSDWSFINNSNNIDDINEEFKCKLLSAAEQFIPKITFTKRPSDKPWMNNNIRRQMRQRNRLYTKAKHSSSDTHFRKYKEKRNEVITLIREAKKQYLQKLQTSLSDPNTKPKQWYKIMNEITNLKNKNNPPPPLSRNGHVDIHPLDKAETLNHHFANISRVDSPPPLPNLQYTPNFSFSNIEVGEQDIKDQLHLLNPSKPGGPDEIMPKLIKLTGTSLIRPLALLFNKSLSLGRVPTEWKMANISAIFKGKGSDQDPTNYRPISITSCLGKLMEKIIFKYLYNYLEQNNILTKHQSGFRPNDSTVNQLLEIYHTILESLDKGKEIKFIFCDVSKAFDKVWHDGLLHKLQKYGIGGNLLEWFKSYLSDRKQRVINEGYKSQWDATSAGVPQGSVLGPYLFLLYINDIVDSIQCNIRLFADDTSLFTVVENNNSIKLLNEDLQSIAQWANQWCITLNPVKTKSMLFTRKRNPTQHNIIFNNVRINDDINHTHLGITLSSDATWTEHTNNIYDKAAHRLNIMRMLKYDIDRKSLTRFYISYIRPILEYGNIIWDNITLAEADLLESIQLDAARIISGLRRGTSHAVLYKELGWIPLSERRKNSKLMHFYKILNNETPSYINNIIDSYNAHQTDYLLRNRNLRYPIPRTTAFKNSFFLSTTDLWNNLDDELKNCTSLYTFKQTIKKRTTASPKHYSFGDRKMNIVICQLRNHKSQLNLDLFNDHLTESPKCPHCNCHETLDHFLLKCSKYNSARTNLMNSLVCHPTIYSSISITADNIIAGSPELSYEDNCVLTSYVYQYIKDTSRL
ncbi:MAG: reverse transcriptase domain-containing protein [Candidatus Thiodiazotropha endolucinida]|nr:endonuclease/exonuclease/phosphatase family protein [Candidatus Thiodiazotropha taylori]MCW4346291.1 reverse transcriptase domain-containing protein [Candidatus Thiodiazotropha endolucinida]